MNSFYVLSFVLAVTAVNGEGYTTKHDDFDMKAAVADINVLKGMVECFLDVNACSDVAAVFKKDLPDAVKTSCVKCTDAQKGLMHTFLDALKEKLPKEYEEFKNKYDPEHKSFTQLEINIAAY